MDHQLLQAFVSVSDTLSFSLAAKKLFITQPAVSKRIAALEAKLNIRLFDRINKQVTLTEAGRVLLAKARHLLLDAEEMYRYASTLSDEVKGTLLLGTSHHIALHRITSHCIVLYLSPPPPLPLPSVRVLGAPRSGAGRDEPLGHRGHLLLRPQQRVRHHVHAAGAQRGHVPVLPRALPGRHLLRLPPAQAHVLRLQPALPLHPHHLCGPAGLHAAPGRRREDLAGDHRPAVAGRVPAGRVRDAAPHLGDFSLYR